MRKQATLGKTKCFVRHAFTLIEILVSIAIIAVIAAIAFPVFHNVRESSLQAQSISDLRQIWMAIQMYREQEGPGAADVGTMYEMKYPLETTFHQMVNNKLKLIPPGRKPEGGEQYYYYVFGADNTPAKQVVEMWKTHTISCGGQSVPVADLSFNDSLNVASPYKSQFGIGVTLDGNIRRRRGPGRPYFVSWWNCQGGNN